MKIRFKRNKDISHDGICITHYTNSLEYEVDDDFGRGMCSCGFAEVVTEKAAIIEPKKEYDSAD